MYSPPLSPRVRVTYDWGTHRTNGSCHTWIPHVIWIRHGTHQRVMLSHINEPCVISTRRVTYSSHTWTSHASTHQRVMCDINTSCHMLTWIMSQNRAPCPMLHTAPSCMRTMSMKIRVMPHGESCHISTSHVTLRVVSLCELCHMASHVRWWRDNRTSCVACAWCRESRDMREL